MTCFTKTNIFTLTFIYHLLGLLLQPDDDIDIHWRQQDTHYIK